MQLFLMISLLVVALLLIGVILIQQGKGAEMGASFGAGASNTLFGAPGGGSFLTKSTTVLAIIFFAIALAIGAVNSHERGATSSLVDDAAATEQSDEGSSAQSAEIPSEANKEISNEIPTDEAAEENNADAIPESIDAAAEEAGNAKKDDDNQ